MTAAPSELELLAELIAGAAWVRHDWHELRGAGERIDSWPFQQLTARLQRLEDALPAVEERLIHALERAREGRW